MRVELLLHSVSNYYPVHPAPHPRISSGPQAAVHLGAPLASVASGMRRIPASAVIALLWARPASPGQSTALFVPLISIGLISQHSNRGGFGEGTEDWTEIKGSAWHVPTAAGGQRRFQIWSLIVMSPGSFSPVIMIRQQLGLCRLIWSDIRCPKGSTIVIDYQHMRW